MRIQERVRDMHGKRVMMFLLAIMGAGIVARGETVPASISRNPLVSGQISDRLSIGAGYDNMVRTFDSSPMLPDRFDADSMYGYVGFDVLRWLTVFVTAGSSELTVDGLASDSGTRMSAGMSAYIWESDVLVPAFMAGRLSIKANAEYLYQSCDLYDGSVSWGEWTLALPIGYEIFEDSSIGATSLQTSLALYGGPIVSFLDGDMDYASRRVGLETQEDVGFLLGFDVYLVPQLSIGAKVTVLDEVSYGATLRFHF